MELLFCRRCGTELAHQNSNVFLCANNHQIFLNATPTVGIFFVTEKGTVLLSQRGIEPHKGMLDSFGGFIDGDNETAETAGVRELQEELGLQPGDYEPLRYITSGIGRYPYKEEVLPILSFFFWTRLTGTKQPAVADDVAAIVELPLHEIDYTLLHDNDIRTGIEALQELFPKENT